MPDQANDAPPTQGKDVSGASREDASGPAHLSSSEGGGTSHKTFLAELDQIWDVPVAETKMAVLFDPRRNA
jgi:hypothetical protein